MSKNVDFGSEGRKKIIKGANVVGDAVKVTLGARGRNVVIEKKFGSPHITKDGVTVAKEIELEDPIENMGAAMIKEVATKTVDISGDGTTTAVVLAQSMINAGLKAVESGANPMDLKRGIEKAVSGIVEIIKGVSKKVKDNEILKQIASISANNDNYIGQLIADAVAKVGRDGLITVEESQTHETTIEVVEGMKLDRGYLSPYFVTDSEKMVAELPNPHILLYDKKISAMKDILHLLEKVANSKRPLLIIAEDLEGEALATLVVNKLRGILPVCAIKSPEFGDRRKLVMEDIATLVGGICISEEKGFKLESADMSYLGSAGKVVVSKDTCLIISGNGKKEEIQSRGNQIKTHIESSTSDYDKEKLKERLARLTNGVAVLKVGGVTEMEIKEKKDRIDDALCATRSAVEEGFVAGGGVTYLSAIPKLKVEYANDDEKIGGSIVLKSLEAPFRQILENGGVEPSEFISAIKSGKYGNGYNIKTNKVENLFETGVIDPTKVVRVAFENAASIAALLLTTECIISEKQKEKNESNAPARQSDY